MGRGLYIHIPFCKKRCNYCDFVTFSQKNDLMEPYIEALKKEIEIKTKNKSISTIFIGGGTPTVLSDKLFDEMMVFINENVKLEDNYEFSVEVNPESVTENKIKSMMKGGVNRVSMGLQATNDILLKNIGRIHDYSTFLKAYNLLKQSGIDNINFDLITGLPGQTVDDVKNTLKIISELDPVHVSVYSLILEEGTPLHKDVKSGKTFLPNEEMDRAMQDLMREGLELSGLKRYEISNFSKPGFECKHNITYWKTNEYIGCGVAASGFEDNVRYVNTNSLEEYISRISLNEDVATEKTKNSINDNMEEFIFMGLRMTSGVSMVEFKNRFGKDIHSVYGNALEKYLSTPYLIREGDYLKLTDKGMDISNYILSDFMLT